MTLLSRSAWTRRTYSRNRVVDRLTATVPQNDDGVIVDVDAPDGHGSERVTGAKACQTRRAPRRCTLPCSGNNGCSERPTIFQVISNAKVQVAGVSSSRHASKAAVIAARLDSVSSRFRFQAVGQMHWSHRRSTFTMLEMPSASLSRARVGVGSFSPSEG